MRALLRAAGAIAFASGLSLGAELPGPASGAAGLRFASAEVTCSPSAVVRGASVSLTIELTPREGFEWRHSDHLPATATVVATESWAASPTAGPLGMPESPDGARRFRTVLRPTGPDPSAELTVHIRYAVGLAAARTADKLLVEEARLGVALPLALTPAAPPASPLEPPVPPGKRAERPPEGRASPAFPALFFAAATVLVLAGIWMSLRRAKRRG